MALFPSSPTNGQTTIVNGITYTYDSTQTAWVRTNTSVVNSSNLTSTVTMVGGAINFTSATLPSASTVNIGAAAANYIFITGNTTITAFDAIQSGTERRLEFQSNVQLIASANIILPGNQSYYTSPGDVLTFQSEGSGIWRCTTHLRNGNQAINPWLNPTLVALSSL
jgi:hypothetical protein